MISYGQILVSFQLFVSALWNLRVSLSKSLKENQHCPNPKFVLLYSRIFDVIMLQQQWGTNKVSLGLYEDEIYWEQYLSTGMRNRELNILFTTVGRIGEGTETFLSAMQDAGPAWDFMKGWSSGSGEFQGRILYVVACLYQWDCVDCISRNATAYTNFTVSGKNTEMETQGNKTNLEILCQLQWVLL